MTWGWGTGQVMASRASRMMRLESLGLRRCGLVLSDAIPFGMTLEHTLALHTLSIDENAIGDEALSHLFARGGEESALAHLTMRANGFGRHTARSLRRLASLRHLEIGERTLDAGCDLRDRSAPRSLLPSCILRHRRGGTLRSGDRRVRELESSGVQGRKDGASPRSTPSSGPRWHPQLESLALRCCRVRKRAHRQAREHIVAATSELEPQAQRSGGLRRC